LIVDFTMPDEYEMEASLMMDRIHDLIVSHGMPQLHDKAKVTITMEEDLQGSS